MFPLHRLNKTSTMATQSVCQTKPIKQEVHYSAATESHEKTFEMCFIPQTDILTYSESMSPATLSICHFNPVDCTVQLVLAFLRPVQILSEQQSKHFTFTFASRSRYKWPAADTHTHTGQRDQPPEEHNR